MKLPLVALLACSLAARAEDACGGTYQGFQYTITSPNYPGDYPARAQCVYRLQGEATTKCEQQFHLQFLDFNLRASEGCRRDSLQVGDRHLYCGNTAGLRKFTGSNNTLILRFRSGDARTARGFKILVSALPCSLKLSPLADPPSKPGTSGWKARDIGSVAYRPGAGGGDGLPHNSTASDSQHKLGSSIRRDQVGSTAVSIPDDSRYDSVSSYLFLPPKETDASITLRYVLGPSSSGDRSPSRAPTGVAPPRSDRLGVSNVQCTNAPASNYAESGGCDGAGRPPQSNERTNDAPGLAYDPRLGFVGSGNQAVSAYYPPELAVYPGGVEPGYDSGYDSGYYPGYYPGYPPAGRLGECCRVPTTRRFSIVSPGFPGGLGAGARLSCRYTIVKSSPDVCWLRLNLRFFNLGAAEPYCSLHYLDVDGQRLCGCRTGQSLQLSFGDRLAKSMSLEACSPLVYGPAYSGDYARRRSATEPEPPSRVERDLGYSYPRARPGFADGGEQTRARLFAGSCQSRLLLDWTLAAKEAFFERATCSAAAPPGARLARSDSSRGEEAAPFGDHCRQIREVQGRIESPLYPDAYPANLDECYRLHRVANFCKLELHVRDFDLEPSQDCASDYLSFGVEREKYCGRSLNDFKTVFDLTRTDSLRIDFASNARGAGRGFDISFSQLPCEPAL
ncbi:uncharacterized protein LOC131671015 isoform X2 [Phymastichus coffea]|uniref:uncharacterized protein LOC131671015 isoform X2 n=1 Tax=Phymastichus coffea TaxID=108790 RepID=UPI00273A94D3|nr:uncharacterized protein LOC131671015 isoform X2 [Phymastichus coffea]